MKRGIVGLSLAVAFASSAHAAPGDPRLVQGVLEWPAKLTVEPFVVIRADDGRWYYSEIKGAKRLESGPLTAGGRVAVLGTEATKPHEIAAIALGSGDAAALALALMPHVNAPAAAAAPAAPLAVESPGPPKRVVTDPSPAPKAVAKPEPPAVTAPAAGPAPGTGPAPATAPSPASPDRGPQPPTSGSTAPANPQLTEPPAPIPATLDKAIPVKGADSEPAAEPPRWAELQGTVKVIAGNWIVVRADNGQLVLVDLSTVRGGAASVRPGAAIAVYGTPSDQKFQAMGILQPDSRPAARPPATVPPRR